MQEVNMYEDQKICVGSYTKMIKCDNSIIGRGRYSTDARENKTRYGKLKTVE